MRLSVNGGKCDSHGFTAVATIDAKCHRRPEKISLRAGLKAGSLQPRVRLWWNWQTRYFEVVVGKPVQVQVLLSAPTPFSFSPEHFISKIVGEGFSICQTRRVSRFSVRSRKARPYEFEPTTKRIREWRDVGAAL